MLSDSLQRPHRVWCSADIYRTDRYVASLGFDKYRGTYVSHNGWHAHTPEPASAEWLGANLRKSLLTAEQFDLKESEYDQDAWKSYREKSLQVYQTWLTELATSYRYRSEKSVMAKALRVSASYPKDGLDPIKLLATNRKRGGVWDAIANTSRSLAVVKEIPFDASDEELGLGVREMLAISTISGERIEM